MAVVRRGGGRAGRVRVALAALAVALGAAACSGNEPDQLLDKVASWAATARLAAQDRATGATSARYTSNVLHATHAELQESVQSLRAALDSSKDSSRLSPPLRSQAIASAAAVEQVVGDMARMADEEPDDVAALLDAGTRADETADQLKTLADSAKKK